MSKKSEEQLELIIEKLDQLIEEKQQLTQLLAQKEDENRLLQEQVDFLKQKLFGTKKETYDPNQSNLFDDQLFNQPEQTGEQSDEEYIETVVRRKKRKGKKQQDLSKLPTKDILHKVTDCTCKVCQANMKLVSTNFVRSEVVFRPAILENHRHFQEVYACATCEKFGTQTPFEKAELPALPFHHSAASASLIAETIYQKFVQKVPAYRQEAYWKLQDYPIPRHNITNWHIKSAEYYLTDLVNTMRKVLLNQEVLHADETTFKVLEDQERQKSYMWLFSSGKYTTFPMHIYHLGPTRAGSVPTKFLGDFDGYLHCDGFSGYHQLNGMTLVACLAHIRRKFFEARPKKYTPHSISDQGVRYCDELFRIDRAFSELTNEERAIQRKQSLQPKLEAFFEWCASIYGHGKVGKALNYALNQKERMMNVLKDGRLELSNNLAERGIKPLVMGRKNWLFSKSFAGARATATIMSLVETAGANGLHPRKYIEFLLTHLPNRKNTPLEAYLPWEETVQQVCQ